MANLKESEIQNETEYAYLSIFSLMLAAFILTYVAYKESGEKTVKVEY
jgi:hypothetical protein